MSPAITTADGYAVWQLEAKLITDLLERIERTARDTLAVCGCPTNPAIVYAIVNGDRPAPWPNRKRTALQTKQRALYAMHALVRAQETRRISGAESRNGESPLGRLCRAHGGRVCECPGDCDCARCARATWWKRTWKAADERGGERPSKDSRLCAPL